MYSITLANGVSYNVQWCGVSNGILSIQLANSSESIQSLFSAFSDPEQTEVIVFHTGNDAVRYEGYTKTIMIQDQRWQDGNVMVQLRREDYRNG